jgi:hypothetical protein
MACDTLAPVSRASGDLRLIIDTVNGHNHGLPFQAEADATGRTDHDRRKALNPFGESLGIPVEFAVSACQVDASSRGGLVAHR